MTLLARPSRDRHRGQSCYAHRQQLALRAFLTWGRPGIYWPPGTEQLADADPTWRAELLDNYLQRATQDVA